MKTNVCNVVCNVSTSQCSTAFLQQTLLDNRSHLTDNRTEAVKR